MRKYSCCILFLLLLLVPYTSFGQKDLFIPLSNKTIKFFTEHLPQRLSRYGLSDIQNSNDSLCIRVWKEMGGSGEILTMNFGNQPYCSQKFYISKADSSISIIKEIDYPREVLNSLYNCLSSYDIVNVKDDEYSGLDGSYIFFEISTPSLYKIVSCWSPSINRGGDTAKVVQMLGNINTILNNNCDRKELYSEFINSLEPGNYSIGLVDYFLPINDEDKTDFYSAAEEKIRAEFNITDSTKHTQYPLVIINYVPAYLSDLNKYTENNIESFTFFKPKTMETAAHYGSIGYSKGVVLLKTK